MAVLDSRAYGGQAGASARHRELSRLSHRHLRRRRSPAAPSSRRRNSAPRSMIPVEVTELDCARTDGCSARRRRRRTGARPHRRGGERGAISPAGDRRPRRLTRAAASGTGPRRSRRGSAPARRSSSSAAAIRPARPPCSSPATRAKVRMMVRGAGLAASMSRYLIDRIAATPTTSTPDARDRGRRARRIPRGRPGARALAQSSQRRGGGDARSPISSCSAAPILPPAGSRIAASSSTATASSTTGGERRRRPAAPVRCKSSVPGVFAVGDVRSGSVKRVGGAIGEGANVVPFLHAFLAANPLPASARSAPMSEELQRILTPSAT